LRMGKSLRAVGAEFSDSMIARIRRARRVSVLTGAGISAESGIQTFRGAGGVWEKFDFRKLATPEGFREDPVLVWEWYQLRQRDIMNARPNRAHETIAEMEPHFERFDVITQNIDGLHARAGSRNVIELHGNIWRARCVRDGTVMELAAPVEDIPPLCQCGSMLRPDVVWFGEQLPELAFEAASEVASGSEVMFVVGTSSVVYPAAYLPLLTKKNGGLVIEMNLEETDLTPYVDLSVFGPAGEVMPVFWRRVAFPESFMTEHPIIANR
jgi:NAD-dependent deacetylase